MLSERRGNEGGKAYLEELVNDVDSHVESLLQQLELGVYLHQPVHQHGPHLAVHRTPGSKERSNNAKLTHRLIIIFPTWQQFTQLKLTHGGNLL